MMVAQLVVHSHEIGRGAQERQGSRLVLGVIGLQFSLARFIHGQIIIY